MHQFDDHHKAGPGEFQVQRNLHCHSEWSREVIQVERGYGERGPDQSVLLWDTDVNADSLAKELWKREC